MNLFQFLIISVATIYTFSFVVIPLAGIIYTTFINKKPNFIQRVRSGSLFLFFFNTPLFLIIWAESSRTRFNSSKALFILLFLFIYEMLLWFLGVFLGKVLKKVRLNKNKTPQV